MLFCPIAASAPRIIDASETITISPVHCCKIGPNGTSSTRSSSAIAATFGAVLMNAVTGVGAPS